MGERMTDKLNFYFYYNPSYTAPLSFCKQSNYSQQLRMTLDGIKEWKIDKLLVLLCLVMCFLYCLGKV